MFFLPWLFLYEAGLWFSGDPYRNLADIWLRELLQRAGFSQYFPFDLIRAVLLGWHHLSKLRWKVDWQCLPDVHRMCRLCGHPDWRPFKYNIGS